MLKRKTNIFVTILFTFVVFMFVGTTNVNASVDIEIVEVSTEDQLAKAVDGVKTEADGSIVLDTDTTEIKLMDNIKLSSYLAIYPVTDLTLDLNGHTIDVETNVNDSIQIYYGKNDLADGSLTIKDSSSSGDGTIKIKDSICINNMNTRTTPKNFKLIIEGGNFQNTTDYAIFNLRDYDTYMKNKNITFDFQIKDGYFELVGNRSILLQANKLTENNVTLNVNFDKLTLKGLSARLVYSDDTDFSIDDVVSEDSKLRLKYSTTSAVAEVTERNISAGASDVLCTVLSTYDTIEIVKKEGFEVADVIFEEPYGYTGGKSDSISITNRGESSLQVKNVTLSGEHADKFEINGNTQPIINSGETNSTAFYIEDAADNFDAGTYTATITVTDMNDKTYTATVTLIVKRKTLGDISVSKEGWTYDGTAHPEYTKSGLDSVTPDKYTIEYSLKGANSWSTTVPKTAGTYTIRLRITDSNLEEKSTEFDFTIAKNDKIVQIIANSNEWLYDGNNHNDTGYIVKYDGKEVADGLLPTGDKISDVNISASVKDVIDNASNNNVIHSYELPNYICYKKVEVVPGTIRVTPITEEIIVTADSANKAYDGSALTKDSYTYTDGILRSADELTATITGSQTYVGTGNNTVSNVKVMRGDKDITSNYTFGTHVDGNLTVTAIDQFLSIADQYVEVNGELLTSELKAALTGAKGNVSFEKKSGNAGEYSDETIGGFQASSSEGIVVMTVKATAYDENNDGTAEYNATEKDFNIHVVDKENVTFAGIPPDQTTTYTGEPIKPYGKLTTGNKVDTSTLEVSYAGTGSTTYNSTTAPTNAGTYTVTYKVPDTNPRYKGQVTYNFTIIKATPTIEISNLSQKVGSIVEPTYTVAPTVTDGIVKVEYKLSTGEDSTYTETMPTKAGTYSVRVSLTGDKNLNDKSEVATLTITKKTTGGGGGGSSTTTYTITVEENKNAEITPNGKVKVEKGADKTFKITAKEGYEIEDVLVDGKSVGAVSKYTFENVKAKHTLEVKVKKVEEEPTTPEVKETFKDVKKNEWYFEAIEYVAEKGLMNGTGNDMFSPNEATTRGMIVTILYRLEGKPEVEECSFTDVSSGTYYAKAIAWAEKNGIVMGLGDGKFGPDDEITREQLATIMYRYSMYKKYDISVGEDTNILSYNDIQDLTEYAFTAMQYACGEGLISGMGDGNLAPKGNATRAQVATILMRYCEKYMK